MKYFQKLMLLLRSKLTGWYEIQGVNTWEMASLLYGAGIIEWQVLIDSTRSLPLLV